MRVISQNGDVDLPYERIVVMQNLDNVIAVTDLQETQIVLGRYSSDEKAEKAIGMLRDAYREHIASGVMMNGIGGTFTIFPNTELAQELSNVAYKKIKKDVYFRLPYDGEVEV